MTPMRIRPEDMAARRAPSTIANWAQIDPTVSALLAMRAQRCVPNQAAMEMAVLYLAQEKAAAASQFAQLRRDAPPITAIAPPTNVRSA